MIVHNTHVEDVLSDKQGQSISALYKWTVIGTKLLLNFCNVIAFIKSARILAGGFPSLSFDAFIRVNMYLLPNNCVTYLCNNIMNAISN